MKHRTPTPWRIATMDAKWFYASADDLPVGCSHAHLRTIGEAEANAAFIVRAVNHHEQLVGALRRLAACPDVNMDTLEPETLVALDQANAALHALDQQQPDKPAAPLDSRELATVLAALRYWQRTALNTDCANPEDDIATEGGTLALIRSDEIDALCERLNT